MAREGTQSMFEALQELDSYYEMERAEKRLKRVFTGLGVDKCIDMFTYRVQKRWFRHADELTLYMVF